MTTTATAAPAASKPRKASRPAVTAASAGAAIWEPAGAQWKSYSDASTTARGARLEAGAALKAAVVRETAAVRSGAYPDGSQAVYGNAREAGLPKSIASKATRIVTALIDGSITDAQIESLSFSGAYDLAIGKGKTAKVTTPVANPLIPTPTITPADRATIIASMTLPELTGAIILAVEKEPVSTRAKVVSETVSDLTKRLGAVSRAAIAEVSK